MWMRSPQISILWQIFRYAISTGCGWVMTGESLSRIWPLCCGVGNEIVFFGDTSPNNLNLIGDVFVNWFPPFFFALPHTGLGTRCWETFLFKENHRPIRPPFVNNGKRIDPLYIGDHQDNTVHTVSLKLPEGNVHCEHCVIQWRYYTGNYWGLCSDGSNPLGCGNQAEFRNGADVTVLPLKTSGYLWVDPQLLMKKRQTCPSTVVANGYKIKWNAQFIYLIKWRNEFYTGSVQRRQSGPLWWM